MYPIGLFSGDLIETQKNTELMSTKHFQMSDISKDIEYSEVAASIPLAKQAKGVLLSSELNTKVTHILCDIQCESVQWNQSAVTQEIFNDHSRGAALIQRLLEMDEIVPIHVVLVSPKWIRDNW